MFAGKSFVIHVSAEANGMGLLENFSIKNIENYEGYIQNVFKYPHKQSSEVFCEKGCSEKFHWKAPVSF